METVPGAEVEEWLEQAGEVSYGGPCNCGRDRCPGQGCSGCGVYDCGANFCGPCNCPDMCTNATGKACQRQNGACTRNPPQNP